jgi:putative peptidoglycan lipid II flippase
MIVCLVFFKDVLGEAVLAIGMLLGSIAQFSLLLLVALRNKWIHFGRPDFLNTNIIMMIHQVPAKISSSLLVGVNPLVDQFFSAKLVIGSITALNYGIKIPAFIIGIITIALGNVLFPYFSKSALENRKETFKKLNQILKYIIIGGSLLVLIICLISTPIISLLFERDAFTGSDTIKVSKIQQMYALQIPSYICAIIMVRFLTSINRNNFMVLASLISLVLNIILNYILIQKLEVFGLALATSLVAIVNSIVLYLYICFINKRENKLF